jgi:acyl carrier protein
MSTEELNQLTSIIVSAVGESAPDDAGVVAGTLTPDTVLFGSNGLLDSIGLVSVAIAVEQAVQDRYQVTITLADEKALSQKHSPYRTVGTLARYAQGEIAAKRGHAG